MTVIITDTDVPVDTDEDMKTFSIGVALAEWFIKNGHSSEDLKSAIKTTMHINLEG